MKHRKEGPSKLTGQAKYIDDLRAEGMLYGITIRSSIPRGRIKKIHFDPHFPWDEFVVVDEKDIPGENVVALILDDQPYLAKDGAINHPEEPILLLAHPEKARLEEARGKVRIEYDPLPPVLTLEDSFRKAEIIWGNDNCFKSYLLEKGTLDDSLWNSADLVFEANYETGAQEQLYIEPNGVMAVSHPQTGVTVWGSLQCPYYVHKALKRLFQLPDEKIRVVQAETGGGFGGKEEYPSLLAGHAALLAHKSGKPVKMIYSRTEDMVATTKRHPSRTRIRSAFKKDGTLLGVDILFELDGGAYATLSSVVLSRGTIHALGPYRCDRVRVKSAVYATNTPPHGAFRGFGAPQSIFAMERHLDEVAAKLALSPIEIRRKNFLKTGDQTATHQEIQEKLDLNGVLDRALEMSHYYQKKAEFEQPGLSPSQTPWLKRGIGFATFMHGSGFTGSGEKYLASQLALQLTSTGKIRILSSSTEIGQGTQTIFTQILAEALSISEDLIEVAQPDTADVPNSGPTVASRTVMVVGKLVEKAAHSLKQTLLDQGLLKANYDSAQFHTACLEAFRRNGPLRIASHYEQPPGVEWDDSKYIGEAYAAYAWAAYVASVQVDLRTYEVQVEDFVAVQEVGKVIHPVLAAGQIEGGVTQGIGFALYEKVVWKDGKMANPRMTNYIIPTAADAPPIHVGFLENPTPYGPQGAKGIGELPMDGPAPAILNAIAHATGTQFRSVPLLPEDLFDKLSQGPSL